MNIGYEQQGSGPPVIMIHGLGGSSNTFQPQAQSMMQHYHIIRPDLPGAGQSGSLPVGTLAGVADMLVELAFRLNVKSAHWVGHSLGAVICQIVALRHSASVNSLTLLGPFAEVSAAAREALKERAEKIRTRGFGWFVDGYIASAVAKSVQDSDPVVSAFLRESILRQSPQQYADFCIALATHSSVMLEKISAPTLLMTGDEDRVGTVDCVTDMSTRLLRAEVRVVRACGHWLTVERPTQVTDAIAQHLRGLDIAQ